MGGMVRMGGIAAASPPERVADRGDRPSQRGSGKHTQPNPPSRLPANHLHTNTHTPHAVGADDGNLGGCHEGERPLPTMGNLLDCDSLRAMLIVAVGFFESAVPFPTRIPITALRRAAHCGQ